MNPRILAAKVIETCRTDGISVTLTKALVNLRRRPVVDDFDQLHGTDTATIVPLWQLRIDSPNAKAGVRYQAVGPEAIQLGLALIDMPLKDFSFVDLGSGKGRSLIVAAEIGFRTVIGVEFANELVEIARRNLGITKVHNATVLHRDAASYELPAGDLMIFMYDPFKAEVMERVVANIRDAVIARPDDKIFVLYVHPECAAMLDATGCLDRIGSPPGREDIVVWKGQNR